MHSKKVQVEMVFVNPNRRVLEGELQFPLLAGQTIVYRFFCCEFFVFGEEDQGAAAVV